MLCHFGNFIAPDWLESLGDEIEDVVTDISDALIDVAIQFGDAIYQDLMEIVEFFENLLTQNIQLVLTYREYYDNIHIKKFTNIVIADCKT